MFYTAQCPSCHEKIHWGETAAGSRSLPERCTYCYEPLPERAMYARAEHTQGVPSHDLPAEG